MDSPSPTEIPIVDDGEPDLSQDNVFLERVETVHNAIKNDDEAFKRCVAEIYVFICSMEQSVRKATMSPLFQKFMGGKVG